MSSRMDATTIGSYWQDDDGYIWRLVGYCDHPTATLKRLNGPIPVTTHEQPSVNGAVGAPIFDRFRRLVETDE